MVKASGRVMLPLHIHWSGDPVYDLVDRRDRKLVYQQVLAEGLDDDVRYFIDVAQFADLWLYMPLPAYVGAGAAGAPLAGLSDGCSSLSSSHSERLSTSYPKRRTSRWLVVVRSSCGGGHPAYP